MSEQHDGGEAVEEDRCLNLEPCGGGPLPLYQSHVALQPYPRWQAAHIPLPRFHSELNRSVRKVTIGPGCWPTMCYVTIVDHDHRSGPVSEAPAPGKSPHSRSDAMHTAPRTRGLSLSTVLFSTLGFVTALAQTVLLQPVPTRAHGETVIIEGMPSVRQWYRLSCEYAAAAAVTLFWGEGLVSQEHFIREVPRHPNPHLGFRATSTGHTAGPAIMAFMPSRWCRCWRRMGTMRPSFTGARFDSGPK